MKFATKWNELINGNEKVTADKNRKQSKPTLVLSVIGDSNTFVPNKWPKDVFQAALIETAKSEKGKVFCLHLKCLNKAFKWTKKALYFHDWDA